MTFSSSFHVPGAFHVEGVHPGLFRPPVPLPSPGAAAVESIPKRKRNHDDISRRHGFSDDATATTPGGHYGYGDAYGSVNTRTSPRSYVLAGQLDTPSGAPSEYGILGESVYSDSDYRRALGSKRPRGDNDMDIDNDESGPGPTRLFNLPPQPRPAQPSWGAFAFSTLGGVVGRVWDFCRSGVAFRGFYAGGGKGFDADSNSNSNGYDAGTGTTFTTEKQSDVYIYGHQSQNRYPGSDTYFHFPPPCEDVEPHDDDSRSSTPTRPAAKRRQTDLSDDLGRNWVMVSEPSKTVPRRPPLQHQQLSSSPRNRNQGPSVTTGRRRSTPNARLASAATQGQSSVRRPASRLSHAHSNSSFNVPRPASSASYASPRSPSPSKIPRLAATSSHFSPSAQHAPPSPVSPSPSSSSNTSRRRRTTTMAPSLANTSSGSLSSQHQQHRRTHSAASAASSRASFHEGGTGGPSTVDVSPRLDPEAKQLAARRKMEERDADVRMTAFNKRLQDMIRQGKEALGTTIEIDSTGGGWEDED